eukprot:scaffold1639_cov331-Pavlova_lutheri.AAC.20
MPRSAWRGEEWVACCGHLVLRSYLDAFDLHQLLSHEVLLSFERTQRFIRTALQFFFRGKGPGEGFFSHGSGTWRRFAVVRSPPRPFPRASLRGLACRASRTVVWWFPRGRSGFVRLGHRCGSFPHPRSKRTVVGSTSARREGIDGVRFTTVFVGGTGTYLHNPRSWEGKVRVGSGRWVRGDKGGDQTTPTERHPTHDGTITHTRSDPSPTPPSQTYRNDRK